MVHCYSFLSCVRRQYLSSISKPIGFRYLYRRKKPVLLTFTSPTPDIIRFRGNYYTNYSIFESLRLLDVQHMKTCALTNFYDHPGKWLLYVVGNVSHEVKFCILFKILSSAPDNKTNYGYK